jgi:type IV pilus assembly protein PilY1
VIQEIPMKTPLRFLRDRAAHLAVFLACLMVPVHTTRADIDADLFLFTTSVPPNVMILLDNSGSMNEIVWHPAYDPTVTPACTTYNNNTTYSYSSNLTITTCGFTRTLYHDSTSIGGTRISGRYLNWYFSSAATPYMTDISATNNGVRVCPAVAGTTYGKYRRNRMTAAKQVVLDTICRVVANKEVRFGLAVFRDAADPNGGFVTVGSDNHTAAHALALESAVASTAGDTWTPLGESLFQVYSYFMGRSTGQQPAGATSGTLPVYQYNKSAAGEGGAFDTGGPPGVPACPIGYTCQKNFLIVITDGEPTKDDFDQSPAATAVGFSNFGNLIGDFNPDGEIEVVGNADESALYMDDIAKFMHETDVRPDMTGEQVIDVYTIGFTTNGPANALLQKTAQQGNGTFFTSNNAEELTTAIVATITDIIEKTQSFTAATVPSTRTAAGGDFYTSFFLPTGKTSFWQGHLRAFGIDAIGNIYDQTGACPLQDPTAGECNSGPFLPGVQPFWDAGEQVPLPGVRNLYTTRLTGAITNRVPFDSTITAADLTLSTFTAPPSPAPNPIYPGSNANNATGLANEIVSYVRGCEWATGVAGANVSADVTCVPSSWRLGDIFHSAPVVVGVPRSAQGDPSYSAFATTYNTRRRVIYAGANDGFLHAFDAGTWNAAATPPGHNRGTGAELFGFMPWQARQNIKNLRIDNPADRHHYVDGSPQAADVWIYPTPTSATKAVNGSEWRTYVVTGMRDGGKSFFALDVTDPTAAGFPTHVWDFPSEADPNTTANAASILPYLGEGWSQPVITRVRVKIGANNNSGKGFERWVMIIGGGYSASGDPNDIANYSASAIAGRSIVMVDIKTGKVLAMKRFTTTGPLTDPQRQMLYAIPSTPSVLDLDYDGFADEILIGDLGGQLWKWVVNPIGEDRVNDGSAVGDYTQPNWLFKKFFQAPVTNIAGVDHYKSIFYPPAAAFQSKQLWYSFGTGERNAIQYVGDPASDENNRVYAIRDADPLEKAIIPNPTLLEANLTDISASQACSSILTPGYYFTLADGEKIVTNTEIFAGLVLVGSFTPANTGDPCTSKGTGKLYVFDIECGGGYFTDVGGNPQRGLSMGEGMPTDPQISVGVDGKDNMVFIEKSGADLESIKAPNIPAGAKTLLYWREIH